MQFLRTNLNRFLSSLVINWPLLFFLLLFLNVKLVVKIAAIVLLCGLNPDFRFGLRWKNSRLPLFYPFLLALALFNGLASQALFEKNYPFVFLYGAGIWMLCLLAAHQVRSVITTTNNRVLYRTLALFFLLNAGVSLVQYLGIVLETGAINPFRYQGNYQKYFISTGDYIKGISFDTSTTNAVLNSFGAVFFFYHRNWVLLLVCTITLLATGSNLVNLLFYTTLLLLFVFCSTREQKSMVVICLALLAIFIGKVSPQNNQYVLNAAEKWLSVKFNSDAKPAKETDVREMPDTVLTTEQRKEKIALLAMDSLKKNIAERLKMDVAFQPGYVAALADEKPVVPTPSIHSAPYQNRDDTSAYRLQLLHLIALQPAFKTQGEQYEAAKLSGKLLSGLQTVGYLRQHPLLALTGTGLGRFSSKVAFKATALHFAGGFPPQFAYIHPAFLNNHLSLYAHFFSKRPSAHSVVNAPNSVYNQLLGEYGLAGLAGFFVFYCGFFAKHHRKLTYGLPLLFLLLNFLLIDYWFEQLSVVVVFEVLLFLNLKEFEKA